MLAVALELDFIQIIRFRTKITAVFLHRWNLTLALLVSAFVPAFGINDVIHNSPHLSNVARQLTRAYLQSLTVPYLGVSSRNCLKVDCTATILSFNACSSDCDF